MRKLRNDNPTSPLVFYVFYFIVFFSNAIYGSFMNMYLGRVGMPAPMIGVVNGIIQVLSFFIFPMWGMAADRATSKNKVLLICVALSIGLLYAFSITRNIYLLALVMMAYTLCHNPMPAIYETITMEFTTKNGWQYGPIRMSGTIGFSIMAALAGFVINDNEALLFPLIISVNLLAGFAALFLPKAKGAAARAKERGEEYVAPKRRLFAGKEVYALLKNPRLRNVLILYGVSMMCSGFGNTYYGVYMDELGGNYLMVGIANMILGLSEIPFHIGPGARWLKRIGVEKSMLVVTAVGFVRWIIVAMTRNPWLLVLTKGFNGIMLVPTIVGIVEMVYQEAPDDLKATASQALRTPFQVGGQLLANFGGSSVVSALNNAGLSGMRIGYAILSPITAVAGILVGGAIFRRERREKKEAAMAGVSQDAQ